MVVGLVRFCFCFIKAKHDRSYAVILIDISSSLEKLWLKGINVYFEKKIRNHKTEKSQNWESICPTVSIKFVNFQILFIFQNCSKFKKLQNLTLFIFVFFGIFFLKVSTYFQV